MKLYSGLDCEERKMVGRCWGPIEEGREYTDADLLEIVDALGDYFQAHGIENDEENAIGTVCVNALNALAEP